MAKFITLVGSMILAGLPLAAEACCSYGCCDCSCVGKSAADANKKADQVTAKLNKALKDLKLAGYVSDVRIKFSSDPEKSLSPPQLVPRECKYTCSVDGADLVCKLDCPPH